MNAATAEVAAQRAGGASWLWRRQLTHYPDSLPRTGYLAITVLATITLYYELYVGGSVSTLILANLHMSFTFFAVMTAFGSLIGAFGSLLAGLADRYGRANLVVFGLLFAALFVGFLMPAAHSKWVFGLESFVVGFVEGVCLVATPALIRDFSPQVGRGTAMGFWTSGPVLGSLIVAVVGSATIPAVIHDQRFWTHEYRICGIAGLVVFLIALAGLRELSPQLRDQLMVTMRDRALIEIRARGLDVTAALRNPFRQLLKADVVVSALAIALFLLIYYAAVGFLVIYLTTAFTFSLKQANGLGNWEWGANAAAVILIGVLSDVVRVRKPFMLIGGVAGAVMTVVFLSQFGRHPSYYTMAMILLVSSVCLGVAYVTWMASFTETVEARNPALTATGLAIWGWIIRIVVCASFLIIPAFVTSVTPLVDHGSTVSGYAAKYKSELAFAQAHPAIVATAQKYADQLANAQRLAPELAVLQAHPTLFAKLNAYPNPANAPASLISQAIAAAGGGTKGVDMLDVISANGPAIEGVIAVSPQLNTLKPFAAQLTALSKVPPSVRAYLAAYASSVQKAAADTASQWRDWFWVCFGGIVFFVLCIPLLRGRWRPQSARRDEAQHETMVAAELAKLEPAASG
jgi:MFS family permease